MGEPAPTGSFAVEKRRTSRVAQSVPVVVTGIDALGRTFCEHTSTEVINCQGCRYPSKHYLLKNMRVMLEIPPRDAQSEPRKVRARVASIQRPRTVRDLFQINVELETGGNVWGIEPPPPDWFPFLQTQNGGQEAPSRLPAEVFLLEPEEAGGPQDAGTFPEAARTIMMPPDDPSAGFSEIQEELARLVDEAKQELRSAARRYAMEAASDEACALVAALQVQLRSAADHYLAAAAAAAVEKALPQTDHGPRPALHEDATGGAQPKEVFEQAIDASLERMRASAADIERTLDNRCHAAAARWMAAIAKSAEITQTTFDSLFKTTDWYEKKLQRRMQELVESGVERAADGMREKAGEMASLFAAELGHFSRSYIEHTQEEFEAREKWAEDRLNDICRRLFSGASEELRRLSDFQVSPASAVESAAPSAGPREPEDPLKPPSGR